MTDNRQDLMSTAFHLIFIQETELTEIVKKAQSSDDYETGLERLDRWKDRTMNVLTEHVNPKEGMRLEQRCRVHWGLEDPQSDFHEATHACKAFLTSLKEDLISHPDLIPNPSAFPDSTPSVAHAMQTEPRSIFIVHGHDETNLMRLKELLEKRWSLVPLVLSTKPGQGRTLIEKFEQEAQRAAFAFVLLTPDDVVSNGSSTYAQARPNVLFELGWLYAKLGRPKVCILFRCGTNIHSDLKGISRIEFTDNVGDKIIEIERELTTAGLLPVNQKRQ